MRIVAGDWRGRTLVAPPGQATRPTADRVRQALFDILMHAEWGGRTAIEDAVVLDVFAGTGALGLEALSRGAASACFIENDAAALKALRANIAACKAGDRTLVLAADALGGGGAGAVRMPPLPSSPGLTRGPPKARASAGAPGSRPGMQGKWPGDAAASLVFLDPPYGQAFVPRALSTLQKDGRIAPGALIVAETGRDETWVPAEALLAERLHGAARVLIFRMPSGASVE